MDSHGHILDRDRTHAAASRLNLQFYLWKDALKFNIHPSILPSLSQTPSSPMWHRVAACGLSTQLPEAQLDGFDLVLRQVPHQKWLPSKVNRRYWNILEDFPDDLVGKYDYVHTRLPVLIVEKRILDLSLGISARCYSLEDIYSGTNSTASVCA